MNELRKAIWEAIKNWDINTPEYSGYCKANGSHVETIFNAVKALAQPEQEPVAWDGACVLGHCNSPAGCEESNCCRANYTAPPKREWVGLTDEEIEQLGDKHLEGVQEYIGSGDYVSYVDGETDFARAIEQALKEKNA